MSDAQTSVEVAALFEAFAIASGIIENIKQNRDVEVKMKTGGKYTYSYATLAQILHDVRKPLTDNGMWYTQYIKAGEMVTRLLHKSGQWMESGMIPMSDMKGGPQDIGVMVSFFKRYSLSEALGLATEEDNAGEDGGKEVDFRARGTPKQRDQRPSDGAAEDNRPVEPPMGWGDWARGFIEAVNSRDTEDELNGLIEVNKQFILGSQRFDKTMYADIGKAITNKRSVLNDGIAF